MDYFQLSLSSTDNTFSAGQTIEGSIRVCSSQPMAVNAVVVRVKGRVSTWFERREPADSDKSEPVLYAAEQDCLNLHVSVLDPKPANYSSYYLLAAHRFAAELQSCEAVLHRTEWYNANSVTEKDIIIVPAFVAPSTNWIPLKKDTGNEVGWLCCVRGRISGKVFFPGGLVPISVDIHNNSSRTMERLEVTLVERSSFIGKRANVRLCNDKDCSLCGKQTKTEVREKVLVRMDKELAVEPYTSTTLLRTLTLPQSVEPSFDNCPIVQNRHFIKISLVPDTWIGGNSTTEVPIKIRPQVANLLLPQTQQLHPKGVREPTAPFGAESFTTEKSLCPLDNCVLPSYSLGHFTG
ncbi:hypothetical protein AAVH_21916 [Aphelenchoides avenae]|nr:hypothetical protein AAVH_21916 [Aphelenchus avenae]